MKVKGVIILPFSSLLMPRKCLPLPPLDELFSLFELDSESESGLVYRSSQKPAGVKKRNGYWYVSIKSQYYLCHRIVYFMETKQNPRDNFVDHAKRNPSVNSDLRLATVAQNTVNTPKRADKKYTSIYKGVSWNKTVNKWVAQVYHNKRSIHLGCFESEDQAALAYNKAAIATWGEFAFLNEVKQNP